MYHTSQRLIGGGNDSNIGIFYLVSSNTSHLAEMGEAKLPTYFIKDASEMESAERLHHFLQDTHLMALAENWLPPAGVLTVGVTAGASGPNNLIEEVILRVYELRGTPANEVLGSIHAGAGATPAH